MKKNTVQVNQKSAPTYEIIIGKSILKNISDFVNLSSYTKVAIITDPNVAKFHLSSLQEAIPNETIVITTQSGEKHKTIEAAGEIWKELRAAKFDRKSLVINLGGGVIGDMGGFAASTYMRGIDFINIPTTILAQVDESVGGKTGVDFDGIKNLIGTFEQPRAVIIDVQTLSSLPDREFLSGFAEIIKHGLIADKSYFETVTAKAPRDFSPEELAAIIAESCEIKRKIVEEDTTEKGSRKLVNFGHTIGHAVESLLLETEKPLLHGEAVSIGMVAEAKLSELKGYLTHEDVVHIKHVLQKAGLPTSIPKLSAHKIFEKIAHDKKNVSGKVNWTLLKEIGDAAFDEVVDQNLVEQVIEELLDE